MSAVEYRHASAAQGGLLVVSDVEGIAFGDRVRIRDHQGANATARSSVPPSARP